MGLFSFLRAKSEDGNEVKTGDPVEYNGYTITPAPRSHEGQFITAGVIAKAFPDGTKRLDFIRADVFPNWEGACQQAILKGKRIIDEQGDRLFADL